MDGVKMLSVSRVCTVQKSNKPRLLELATTLELIGA